MRDYLKKIGVAELPATLSPFDPGYDLGSLEGHLEQSHHMISSMKISMACWMIADERVTRRKVAACKKYDIPAVTGGGPFEVAVAQKELEAYLDLCADLGFDRIEAGEGFSDLDRSAAEVCALASARGLNVQFEMGKKHGGAFTADVVSDLLDQGQRWIDAGATHVVVEARESAQSVGLYDDEGNFNAALADRFAEKFGIEACIFEAPNKPSQFTLMDHFGPLVRLCNVRLEEILRVEIYRRGLHSDAFHIEKLKPRKVGQ
jgi:phosphosulfolactate synthase